MRENSMLLARVEVSEFLPSVTSSTGDAPGSLAVLVDTSASRLLGFERQLSGVWESLRVFEDLLPKPTKLLLVAFDQEIEVMHDGKITH